MPDPDRESFSIAQVSPRPWGSRHEVDEFVGRVSEELAGRGHRVLIAAPSESRTAIRDSRNAIRAAAGDPRSLFTKGEPRVLAIGQSIPLPSASRRRPAPAPIDVSRALEELFSAAPLDFVHVHEPFAPSPSSAALRHSHSLNVASFHEPAERVISTQVARPLVEIFFGRIDARTASSRATGELLERYFPGDYRLIPPGADAAEPVEPKPDGTRRIVFCDEEERGALRLFLRGLRRLPLEHDWEAIVCTDLPPETPIRVSRKLRDRVRIVRGNGKPEGWIAGADVVCLASGGVRPSPNLIRKALAAGAVPVVSDIEIYRELAEDGERGLLFPPGDVQTLAAQMTRLLEDGRLRERLRRRTHAAEGARSWAEVADEVEELYRDVAARRHDPRGDPEVRRRISGHPHIHCDLHMHTDHSPDCATPVEELLVAARSKGLGAIAITDHNEISGALEARELAERNGVR